MQNTQEYAVNLRQAVEEYTVESSKTVGCYLINLLTFIIALVVYYGLIIIFIIATLLHWYDRSDEEYFSEEIVNHDQPRDEFFPINFSDVQISVWCAVIPWSWYTLLNYWILKMNSREEYEYFFTRMFLVKISKYFSWVSFVIYLIYWCILMG